MTDESIIHFLSPFKIILLQNSSTGTNVHMKEMSSSHVAINHNLHSIHQKVLII